MNTNTFISAFANDIEAMLSYREALGFSRRTYERALLSIDRYAADSYPDVLTLSRELVTGWINGHIEKSLYGISNKATAIRLLGKYLSAIGKESYILPDEYVVAPKSTFVPYVFTDDELTRLFRAIDRLPKTPSNPLASKIPPVLFRLIYTCGLRPNEGRELRRFLTDGWTKNKTFITSCPIFKRTWVMVNYPKQCITSTSFRKDL